MGFAAGFQVGAQAVERGLKMREEDQLKKQMAEAYRAPTSDVSYTSDQMAEMRRMQGLGTYDIESVPGAEGQTPTLRYTPKQGLDLQGDVPAAPTTFAPQQVQMYGGQSVAGQFDPTVLQGLQAREAARVLGASGDYRGAAALQQQASDLEYQAKRRPLELAGLKQQGELNEANLAERRRVATENENIASARGALAAKRKEGPLTAAIIAEVSGEFKLDPTQFLKAEDAVSTQEIKDLKRDLSKAAMGGDTTFNNFLAAKFDPDKTDNITPKVTKTKDGSFVVMYGDRVLPEYGTHKNMMSLVGGVINMIDQNPFATLTTISTLDTQEAQRAASRAAAAASNSTVSLNTLRGKLVNQNLEDAIELAGNTKQAKKLMADFQALTPEEQNGAKGKALEKQYNMLGAKPGAQLRIAPERPGQTMTDYQKEQLTAYNKWLAEPRNERKTGGEKDAKADEFGIGDIIRANRAAPATKTSGVSLGGDAYATDREAPPPAAAPKQGLTTTVAPPALSTENTKLLGRAGSSGYNVQMPDGTTRVLSISELNDLGYQFIGGNTGLPRPWYADLLPRR